MEKNEFIHFMVSKTKLIAREVIILVNDFPQKTAYFVVGKQLIRSASSTAANYRAVLRARSKKEFYSKMSIVVEECDETLFWLELLEETNLVSAESIITIKADVLQVLKIVSKARKNT